MVARSRHEFPEDYPCRVCTGKHLMGALRIPEHIWEAIDRDIRTGWFGPAAWELERLLAAENRPPLQFPPSEEELRWVCEARFAARGYEFPVERLPEKEDVLARGRALSPTPEFIEAYWDGDSGGWYVVLSAFYPDGKETDIACLRTTGDARFFVEDEPEWPEARFALEVGPEIAEVHGVPFIFKSPDQPRLPDEIDHT